MCYSFKLVITEICYIDLNIKVRNKLGILDNILIEKIIIFSSDLPSQLEAFEECLQQRGNYIQVGRKRQGRGHGPDSRFALGKIQSVHKKIESCS